MRVGTSHFASLVSAQVYYAKQGFDLEAVKAKVDSGEIHIGPPNYGAREHLSIDSDGRYHIEDSQPKSVKPRARQSVARKPAIRFIVHTVTSERDRYGNCYRFTTVRSTITGKTLTVTDVGGDGNIPGKLVNFTGTWDSMDKTESAMPKRLFKAAESSRDNRVPEHLLTEDMFAKLEK